MVKLRGICAVILTAVMLLAAAACGAEQEDVYLRTEYVQTMASGTQWRCEYTYDENGNLENSVLYYNGNAGTPVAYECDKNGNVIRETGGEGTNRYVCTYEYDKDGSRTKKVLTYTETGKELRSDYLYDGGRLTKIRTYSDMKPAKTYDYEYSEDGMSCVISISDSMSRELEDLTYCEYDENGNLILERRCNPEDALIRQTAYAYDENGNLVTETATDGDGEFEYEYTYTYVLFQDT